MSFDNKIGEGKYVITVDNQGAISQLQQFDSKVKQSGQNMQSSFRTGLASAVSLTSGLASLAFQTDNIEKSFLRVRKTALEMSRAQEEVNKLVQQGKTDTLDYQQAQERLAIATEKNKQAQQDATQSQVAFTLSMAQTALTIPSAIQGIKGLTSVTGILNMSMSKWVLIALAAIAAYEGIAQAVKHFTGQDYTITSAVGNMINNISGLTDTVKTGTDSMVGYSSSVGLVGVTAQATASSLGQVNQQIETTNAKLARGIDTLKKNENEIKKSQKALIDEYGSFFSGTFRTSGPIMGGDAAFQIKQAGINYRNLVYGGYTQTPSFILEAAAEADRIENDRRRQQKNPFGLNTTGARISRTISNLLSDIPDWMRKPLGTSRSVMLNNAQAQRAQFESLSDELAKYGFSVPTNSIIGYGGKGNRPIYANDAQEKLNNILAEINRRKEETISRFVNRSGLARSQVIAMQTTQQGMDDLYGIIDYKERLARASTGSG